MEARKSDQKNGTRGERGLQYQQFADLSPVERLDSLPKSGKVNEMCREWLVREDGAFAYQLQSQEINQHYSGNKHRNAQVREDFPCAMDQQMREQHLAEQASAVYQKMLQEQEEVDKQIAKDLADKIEREEQIKRRLLERRDEDLARQIIEKDKYKKHSSPQKPTTLPLNDIHHSPHRPDATNYFANLPRRQAPQMPIPQDYQDLYTEPYRAEKLTEDFDRIDIQDEEVDRKTQEERDAELARQLQEQLSNSEESIINRDRRLAMEAQDKELAKLLQERERAKAKRAKEKAKQRAIAKKQQLLEQEQQNMNQILPDDSYSNPIDLLPQRTVLHSIPQKNMQLVTEDDTNYCFPVDVLPARYDTNPKQYSPVKQSEGRYDRINGGPSSLCEITDLSDNIPPPVRPTQLDLRSPLTQKVYKPRFPDPVIDDMPRESAEQSPSPSKQHMNIAMAIDPTYPRRTMQSPPSYDTTSSTVTTSTSSSSSGLVLPTPDLTEDDHSPVPPYMPIQGQRRTASLEKKSKRKAKDGCKQQ